MSNPEPRIEHPHVDKKHHAWTFQKDISLGNIIQMLLLGFMAISAWSNLQSQLAVLQDRLDRIVALQGELADDLKTLTRHVYDQQGRLNTLEQLYKQLAITPAIPKETFDDDNDKTHTPVCNDDDNGSVPDDPVRL